VDSFNVPTDELFCWFDAKRVYASVSKKKKKEGRQIGNEIGCKRENE
jgi:hypothetical protein